MFYQKDYQIKIILYTELMMDSKQNIPNIIGIGSTGGNLQSISLINPKIETIKNNNLVFNLSDTSLSGYDFKLY